MKKWWLLICVTLCTATCIYGFSFANASVEVGPIISMQSDIAKPQSQTPKQKWLLLHAESDNQLISYLLNPQTQKTILTDDLIRAIGDKLGQGYKHALFQSYLHGFSPDGTRATFVTESHQENDILIEVYDFSLNKVVHRERIPHYSLYFLPKLNHLLVSGGERDVLLDVMTGRKIVVNASNKSKQRSRSFSPDGHTLAYEEVIAGHTFFMIKDVVNDNVIRKIDMGTEELSIEEWSSPNRHVYSNKKDQLFFYTISSGMKSYIGTYTRFKLLTPDEKILFYTDQDQELVSYMISEVRGQKIYDPYRAVGFSYFGIAQYFESPIPFENYLKNVPIKGVTTSSILRFFLINS